MITNIAPPGNIAPENLLDNSYFERVINQKGQLSYAGLWNKAFDRWIVSCAEGVAVWVNSNGNANDNIDLPNKVGDQAGQILQVIPNKARFLGKQITLALKTKGGGLRCATGTIAEFAPDGQNASRTHAYFTDSDLWLEVYDVSDDTGLYVRIGNQSDYFIALAWAALYEGIYTSNTLPLYLPHQYNSELFVCQRYFSQYDGITVCWPDSTNAARVWIPVTGLRSVPTITSAAINWIMWSNNGYSQSPTYSSLSVQSYSPNGVLVRFDGLSTSLDMSVRPHLIYIRSTLSAEL